MKKIMVLALAVVLTAAFAMPASALENKFGGYWRTRAIMQQNFTGEDKTEAWDDSFVDTRTRLFYTAIINENFKFVNAFEFNSVWGDTVGGDLGTDGMGNWRVKHSYADFTLAPVNFKIGMQPATIGRGFLFDDDFAGAIITFKGEGFAVPFIWMKPYEGGKGLDANDGDFDFYALAPLFTISEMFSVKPYVLWATSANASAWKPTLHAPNNGSSIVANASASLASMKKIDVYYIGLDLDAKFDMGKAWFTGIYQGGSADYTDTKLGSVDFKAWLAAVGASVNLSEMADIHGQFFYATGDDPKDKDYKAFFVPSQNDYTGQSYYWAEILGYGIFDDTVSAKSPYDHISNIMAANIGTTIKPIKDFSVTLDVWYAKLAEKDTNNEDYLGTEIDLILSYELLKGLKLDLVGAYLLRGDATYKGLNEANPYEVGTQLSFTF